MSSLKALQDLIHEKYDIPMSELDPEASMRDKGLDSLALAEFIFAVEDHFHVVVPDDDPSIMSLGGLAVVVDRLLIEKADKADKAERATSRTAPAGSDTAGTVDATGDTPATGEVAKDAKASTPA
jgi:acyl carrier protein